MPAPFSTVTDNSLLPFATAGSEFIPRNDDGYSPLYAISQVFENGLLMEGSRMTSVMIGTNGEIYLFETATGSGSTSTILPFTLDQDNRLSNGAVNQGIWLDYNTDRDSLVMTWNAVGQYSNNNATPCTYQIEIRDIGDGDSEIIYRFNNMSILESGYYSYITAPLAGYTTPFGLMGSLDLWDESVGNTGVAGIWQFRIEDGFLTTGDFQVPGVRLVGDGSDDRLIGGIGNDTVNGLGGNDTLSGGGGHDTVMGGAGDNVLYGGAGADYITAEDGDDRIFGGAGTDLIGADLGNDTIYTGGGQDIVYASGGDDLIDGTDSQVADLHGGDGNDTVLGGVQRDSLYGDAGDDSLVGAAGDDVMEGGDGNDVLQGGVGRDTLFGGAGDDTLTGDDSNTAYYWYSNDALYGGDGNDLLSGAAGYDFLEGGSGNDTLIGGLGSDTLRGGDGDDFIFGSVGDDVATGGAGADRFMAGRADGDGMRITDYNAAEGDALVLDGREFDAANLRLLGGRLSTLDGAPGVYASLSLVEVNGSGAVARTLFSFDNAADIGQLILRLPIPDGNGPLLVLDLV